MGGAVRDLPAVALLADRRSRDRMAPDVRFACHLVLARGPVARARVETRTARDGVAPRDRTVRRVRQETARRGQALQSSVGARSRACCPLARAEGISRANREARTAEWGQGQRARSSQGYWRRRKAPRGRAATAAPAPGQAGAEAIAGVAAFSTCPVFQWQAGVPKSRT